MLGNIMEIFLFTKLPTVVKHEKQNITPMKTINFITILFVMMIASCTTQSAIGQLTLGKIVNSLPVLTADKQTLITNYSKNLLEISGIRGNFSDVKIVQADSNYYLVFTGPTYKSSLRTQIKPGVEYVTIIEDGIGDGRHISCTTSDCASEPKGGVPSMIGLACLPCANQGKCTKTVSTASLLQ